MPLKDDGKRKEYHTTYMREVWYPKNRTKHMDYVRRNKQKVAAFIDEYKRKNCCMDCGFPGREFPCVLDFDHMPGSPGKKFNIGSWSRSVLSVRAIQHEIEKCELVCANCHRIRTFTRKTSEESKSR